MRFFRSAWIHVSLSQPLASSSLPAQDYIHPSLLIGPQTIASKPPPHTPASVVPASPALFSPPLTSQPGFQHRHHCHPAATANPSKMQDKEFTMAKSLFTALSGRARVDKQPESSSSSKAKSHSSSKTKASSRRHRFDDKSGPPPPRGSVTDEKLSYLDWRLKRINNLRLKSERTSHCWIDGRDTIGRNSIDVAPLCRSSERASVRAPARAPASAPAPRVVAIAPGSIAAVIASEKAAGLKALEHAIGGDSMLASMPRLAKRDSSSGSEMSGSSDSHDLIAPAAVLDAASDKDVGALYFTRPRQSFLVNIGSRLSKSSKKQHALASKADAACQQTTGRSHRSVARIWHS